MRPRIAITGIGVVSSVCSDSNEFVEALRTGDRGIVELDDPRLANLRATHAGLIGNVEPAPGDPAPVRCLDRNVHIALRALREALSNAGLGDDPLGPRGGVVFGTCSGGMLSIEKHYEALARGEDPIDEDLLFSKRYYTTAKILAWAARASGPALTVVTACAAGSGAIAQGSDLIRVGMADVVAVGGSDAFSPSTLVGFDALKATAEGMCAPFSNPIGLNLGEGSAFLMLEKMERAVERQAPILGEILGSGLSNDAYHPTAPDPSAKGQIAAMESAVADAGLTPDRIDYVNAHGTGTRANDPAESRAVSRLLRDRASEVPISSTKSMIGHCLGGAGALEASATLLGARAGFIPPTAGFSDPREGCDLDYVSDLERPWKGHIALSNSFGFAGNNACLILDTNPTKEEPTAALPQPPDDSVVITGYGLVTPAGLTLGDDSDPTSRATIQRFPSPADDFEAHLVPEIDPRQVDRRLDVKGMDLCSRYTTMAARSALDSAGLKPRPRVMEKVGLILGIATGPGEGESEHLGAVFESNFDLKRLGHFPYVVPNEVAGNVARSLLLKGHSTVVAAGSGAGLFAATSAYTAVKLGHCETVLAACADELTRRSTSDGFKVGFWGPKTGVTPGEGAAVMVMERGGAARERNATVLAEVLGCSMVTDVGEPRSADRASSISRSLTGALDSAGISAGEVASIAWHGDNISDTELLAVRRVLGEDASPVSLISRLGYAEACLSMFNMAHLIESGSPGDVVAACSVSPEGMGATLVLKLS